MDAVQLAQQQLSCSFRFADLQGIIFILVLPPMISMVSIKRLFQTTAPDYSERFANTAAPLLGFESRCTAVSSISTLLALMLLLLLLLFLRLLLLLLLLLFLLLVLLLQLLFLMLYVFRRFTILRTCAHIVVFQILLPSMHAGRGGF